MTDTATWWTPAGWTSGPDPTVPANLPDDELVPVFQTPFSHPGFFAARVGEVLAVSIHGSCDPFCCFFVAEEHFPQFVVQCLPALVQAFGSLHASSPEG